MGYNGSENWETFSFSVTWSNDEEIYDAVKRAGAEWLAENAPKDDSAELGAAIVTFIREGSFCYRFVGPKMLETGAEWDAIDRREVGEEVKAAIETETETHRVACLKFVHTDEERDWMCRCGHEAGDHGLTPSTAGGACLTCPAPPTD